jgi:hypothetical protein
LISVAYQFLMRTYMYVSGVDENNSQKVSSCK